MKKITSASIFLFFTLLAGTIFAAENDTRGLDLNGRIINDSLMNQYNGSGSNNTTFAYAGENTLRLNVLNKDRSFAKIEGSMDVLLLYGEYANAYYALFGTSPSAILVQTNSQTSILLDLRKLYLALYPEFADITLGRQIINFGVGYLFSPIDVFSTINLNNINFERTGSDIAEVKIPFASTAGIDLVTTLSSQTTNIKSAAKLFANIAGYDLSAIGIYSGQYNETTAGLTFKGDIEVGIHGELVEHFFQENTNNFFEGMMGIDYSFFESSIYLLFEYYYNGQPIDPNQVTPANIQSIQRLFYNKHYLFLLGEYKIDKIRNVSLDLIYNPLDNAVVVIPQYFQNIYQNVDLTVYMRYFYNNLNGLNWVISPNLEYALRLEVLY